MLDELEKTPQGMQVSAQLRGETIAYAVQHMVYNLGANFYEPYINHWRQKFYTSRHPGQHFGSYKQNLGGELIGDVVGPGALIAAEIIAPTQLHGFMRGARRLVDPLYTTAAHWIFAKEKCEPGYEQKIEQWKTFQERNLVRETIITTTAIASNLASQKLLIKNPAPVSVIFTGKLLGASVTAALGLTTRLLFPERIKKMDQWLGKNIFAPMMEDKTTHAGKVEAQRERETELSR